VDEALLKQTKEYSQQYTKHYERMTRKYSRENAEDVGGNQQLSRQGSISMSVEEWEDWIAFLKERNNGMFTKFFPTRVEYDNGR